MYHRKPKYPNEDIEYRICGREGCGQLILNRRRKYCSDRCGRIVNRDNAARRARRRTATIEEEGGPKVAVRICLSCDRAFLSEGPWNRICPRCSERNLPTPHRAQGYHVSLSHLMRDLNDDY